MMSFLQGGAEFVVWRRCWSKARCAIMTESFGGGLTLGREFLAIAVDTSMLQSRRSRGACSGRSRACCAAKTCVREGGFEAAEAVSPSTEAVLSPWSRSCAEEAGDLAGFCDSLETH